MGHRAAPEGPAPDSDKAYPASVRPARLVTDLWSKLHISLAQILYRGIISFQPGLIGIGGTDCDSSMSASTCHSSEPKGVRPYPKGGTPR